MKTPISYEHAKAYLDLRICRPDGKPLGTHPSLEGPFVTLSRESGSGASELAVRLAQRLNERRQAERAPWTVFDQQIVEQVLRDEKLSPRLARYLPEDRLPEITGSVGEIMGLHPNLWSLVQKSNELMRALARNGNVILVGRGANFATCGVQGGVHVRLVAPEGARMQNVARTRGLTLDAARNLVRSTDAARTQYVKSVFDRAASDVTAYDLFINIARVPTERALGVIASMVGDPVRVPAK